jgi:hypothetical protein
VEQYDPLVRGIFSVGARTVELHDAAGATAVLAAHVTSVLLDYAVLAEQLNVGKLGALAAGKARRAGPRLPAVTNSSPHLKKISDLFAIRTTQRRACGLGVGRLATKGATLRRHGLLADIEPARRNGEARVTSGPDFDAETKLLNRRSKLPVPRGGVNPYDQNAPWGEKVHKPVQCGLKRLD